MNEGERQALHLFLGACTIALVLWAGVQVAAYSVAVVLVLGLILVHMKLSGMSLGQLEALVERFERPGVTQGYGALTFAAGTLAILTMLHFSQHMLASLAILGFGDAASTLVGRRARRRLPYSRNKTYAGTAAFFLASALPAVYFAGFAAVIVAAIAALAESLESDIDDNLVVAVACVVAFKLLGG